LNPIIAISGTFAFFAIAQSQTKKAKEPPSQRTKTDTNMTANKHDKNEKQLVIAVWHQTG